MRDAAAAGDSPRLEIPATVFIPCGHLTNLPPSASARIAEVGPFFLGRTPLTNGQYAPFLASGRAAAPPWWTDSNFCAPHQPVVGVTWEEAMNYCSWLAEVGGGCWRLPTETEWEFAMCGALESPRTAWGEMVPKGEIPEGRLAGPWETGRGTPNGYGLLDAGTIVHEWCLDWHEADRSFAAPAAAPRRRASRGGSWRHQVRWSSPSTRSSLPPDYHYSDYGFRVLREVNP